ncbi:hypothetical protein [Burkholderia ubonensis]|uniref:hypothetical protein n=1 Tax=Burkholderia ubonensis TaxID=101571 RepID=UPI000B1DBEAB|nr:hypothetical protein [Burkholderia ubonensis]
MDADGLMQGISADGKRRRDVPVPSVVQILLADPHRPDFSKAAVRTGTNDLVDPAPSILL